MADHFCLSERVNGNGERYEDLVTRNAFLKALEDSHTGGVLHDCLQKGEGLPWNSVAFWKLMEYLPFRRMDLQDNGSWKVIRW